MTHHHKSNRAVEGDPDGGHGRGMPRRPDTEELAKRAEQDKRELGIRVNADKSPGEQYEDEQIEIDREIARGQIPTGATSRKNRDPFPPTRYGK